MRRKLIKNIQPGDVLEIKDTSRLWVALWVSLEDVWDGCAARCAGFHAFGGLWYGDDPMWIGSYGKILALDSCDFDVVARVSEFFLEELRQLCD